MFHVFSITAMNSTVPHAFAVMPGTLPRNTRHKDMVEIVASFETMTEAVNHQRNLNDIYGINRTNSTMIECVETGERYESVEKAAQAIGGAASAISPHLRGVAGFKTVKGYTFRRISR